MQLRIGARVSGDGYRPAAGGGKKRRDLSKASLSSSAASKGRRTCCRRVSTPGLSFNLRADMCSRTTRILPCTRASRMQRHNELASPLERGDWIGAGAREEEARVDFEQKAFCRRDKVRIISPVVRHQTKPAAWRVTGLALLRSLTFMAPERHVKSL